MKNKLNLILFIGSLTLMIRSQDTIEEFKDSMENKVKDIAN